MQTNDNQYSIYLRSTKQRVPCTKQQFDDYYREIDSFRRKQQRHGRCICLPSKQLMCDMDCYTCPYHTPGDTSSLDCGLTDEEGNEMNWLDHLQETMPDLQEPSVEDYVASCIDLKCVLIRLNEIMPQAIEIGKLRQMGLSEDDIAAHIGTPRKTFAYRLKKARQLLEKEFPEFF